MLNDASGTHTHRQIIRAIISASRTRISVGQIDAIQPGGVTRVGVGRVRIYVEPNFSAKSSSVRKNRHTVDVRLKIAPVRLPSQVIADQSAGVPGSVKTGVYNIMTRHRQTGGRINLVDSASNVRQCNEIVTGNRIQVAVLGVVAERRFGTKRDAGLTDLRADDGARLATGSRIQHVGA